MKKETVDRQMKAEIIVGVFVLAVFVGMFYFTIVLSGNWMNPPKFKMDVVFNSVMGLTEGDQVVVRGMPVGKVKRLYLGDDGVHVVAQLDQPLMLREGYKVQVVSSSLLGGRRLLIDSGPRANAPVPSGERLVGEDPYDLVEDAAELVNSAKKAVVDGKMMENMKVSIENLRVASVQVRDVATRLGAGKGTLGRLMSEDDQIYRDVAAAVASLRSVTERIEKGEGLLGQLSKDNTLYTEIQQTVKEARAAVDDFRETSPITTFTSVFFGAF